MGREQELRESARDGNLAKLEALLAGKKSSIMSRLVALIAFQIYLSPWLCMLSYVCYLPRPALAIFRPRP